VLNKLYVHNYRCLQNFEINLTGLNAALLLGRNGTGKSTVFAVLEILQKIGRGVTGISDLLTCDDFAFHETTKPIVFNLSATIGGNHYAYRLEVGMLPGPYSLGVLKESLSVNSQDVFLRNDDSFALDKHHVGLPLILVHKDDDPVAVFRHWLGAFIYLTPVPSLVSSTSKAENAHLDKQLANLVDWMRYHLALKPALYSQMEIYLKHWMPDFALFRLDATGRDERELIFSFKAEKNIELSIASLSDGEKTYVLTAMLLTVIGSGQPFLCFWDEVDQYISLPELSYFITACRREFEGSEVRAQLILTSHNPRVMYEFSGHNSFVLSRASHLQPARLEPLQSKTYLSPDPVQAFENGELG